MPLDLENDTTLTDALGKLEAAEAAETPLPKEAFVQADPDAPAQPEQPLVPLATEKPKENPSDTPAAPDKNEPPAETKIETTPKDDKRTDYSKNHERLEKTWKGVNQRKTELDTRESTLKAREAQLAQQQQELTTQRAKVQQRHTPEEYEQAAVHNADRAGQFDLQAKGLDAQAAEFEEDGKYTEAESAKARARDLREQAAYQRGVSKQLKDHAAHVRSNPDPSLEQLKARNQANLREYTLQAAKEWPELSVNGSAFQQEVVKNIQAARQVGLDENEFPVIRYWSARLAAMEAAAARVSGLESALGAANAKVKELEALTAPGGGLGSVQRQNAPQAQTDDEEGAQLRTQAQNM